MEEGGEKNIFSVHHILLTIRAYTLTALIVSIIKSLSFNIVSVLKNIAKDYLKIWYLLKIEKILIYIFNFNKYIY